MQVLDQREKVSFVAVVYAYYYTYKGLHSIGPNREFDSVGVIQELLFVSDSVIAY